MGLWVPAVLPKTHGFMVRVWVKPTVGTGFVGTGVDWTSLTHAVPVCHPNFYIMSFEYCTTMALLNQNIKISK